MSWVVGIHPALDEELQNLTDAVQEKLYASAAVIEQFGPTLGRPRVDTLNGSRHRNMKELRFNADGGYGGSPLPSTPVARPSSSRPETNRNGRKAFLRETDK